MNGARRRFRSTQAGRSNFAAQQKMPGAHWLQALPGGIPGAIRTRDLPLRSDLGTPVLRDFLYLKIPYFQGFFVL